MKAVIVPSSTGLFKPVYEASKKAVIGLDVKIYVNIETVLKSLNKINKFIIVMGGKRRKKPINALEVYNVLKNNKIEPILIDGWDWGISGQLILNPKSLTKVIRKCCL